jgi:hypothetical protein
MASDSFDYTGYSDDFPPTEGTLMTEQQPPPADVIPGTPVPNLRLYSLTCTPMSGKDVALRDPEQDQPIWFKLAVVATNSSEATRKAVHFFKQYAPSFNITGIEVVRFEALTSLSDTIVVA